MTYTYAILPISKAAYDEIKGKLTDYQDQFHQHPRFGTVIDMHGLALAINRAAEPAALPSNWAVGVDHASGSDDFSVAVLYGRQDDGVIVVDDVLRLPVAIPDEEAIRERSLLLGKMTDELNRAVALARLQGFPVGVFVHDDPETLGEFLNYKIEVTCHKKNE
jgi:hypothetical protein